MSDGTIVKYSNTESGLSANGIALIKLNMPLRASANIQVRIESADCNMISCSAIVAEVINSAACGMSSFPDNGIKTGAFVCDGTSLTYEITDGSGGYTPGSIKRADSIYCAGTKPNCEEEE